jgi:hypothetical protein
MSNDSRHSTMSMSSSGRHIRQLAVVFHDEKGMLVSCKFDMGSCWHLIDCEAFRKILRPQWTETTIASATRNHNLMSKWTFISCTFLLISIPQPTRILTNAATHRPWARRTTVSLVICTRRSRKLYAKRVVDRMTPTHVSPSHEIRGSAKASDVHNASSTVGSCRNGSIDASELVEPH